MLQQTGTVFPAQPKKGGSVRVSPSARLIPQELPTWRGVGELEALLPPAKPFALRGGVDRYGFLHLLARRVGLEAPRRAFANWVHGWIWDESPTAESLHCARLPRDVTVVVRNERERKALVGDGFDRVFVGGLPFAYVDEQHRYRSRDALLAIPPHSAEAERLNSNQIEYLDYLESLKQDFDGIYLSVFYLDLNGAMHRAAKARGLSVIQGARPDDANSLARVRALFDAFSMITTNAMGSHLVYALHAGARFSFCGPLFTYDEDMLLGNGNPNRHSRERVQRLVQIQSSDYLRAHFGRFFVRSPHDGVADPAFASRELGESAMLSNAEIMDALGWSWKGQVHGFLKGGLRRMRRRVLGWS